MPSPRSPAVFWEYALALSLLLRPGMKTRRLPIPALMALSLLASACAQGEVTIEDQGEVSLENPEDEGKGDTVFGKRLRYLVRGEWTWFADQGKSTWTDTEVLSQTDTTVRVRALRWHFALPRNQVVEIAVDARAFNDLGEISTDMAFILMSLDDAGEWNVARCDDRSYFEAVALDTKHLELDATARTESGEVEKTYSFEECGIPEDAGSISMFPFPSSNWGNMEGYYHLDVRASCNGDPCPDAPYPY